MPNVIITPAFAHLRARAQEDKYNAIAGGLQNTSNIVAQALLTYSAQKKQEDTEKLSLLDSMMKTYGSAIGQPALQEYDKILKRKGVPGLPKDTVTGEFLTPPPTLDALVNKEIVKDPELLKQMAVKEATGKSDLDRSLEQNKIDAQKEHYRAMETIAQARADAAKERAVNGRISARTKDKLRIMELELKQQRYKLDHFKAAHAFASKAEANMWGALKAYYNKNTKDEQRELMRPALEHTLRQADVPEEDIPKFFPSKGSKGWFWEFLSNPAAVFSFDQNHAMKGVEPAEIPPEGIKEGTEIVPGVVYKGSK